MTVGYYKYKVNVFNAIEIMIKEGIHSREVIAFTIERSKGASKKLIHNYILDLENMGLIHENKDLSMIWGKNKYERRK